MEQQDLPALIAAFQQRECTGIAAFLAFMPELEPDEQERVLEMMLLKKLGYQVKTLKNPIAFFTRFHELRLGYSPYVDEGVKQLDITCQLIADMWTRTEQGLQ